MTFTFFRIGKIKILKCDCASPTLFAGTLYHVCTIPDDYIPETSFVKNVPLSRGGTPVKIYVDDNNLLTLYSDTALNSTWCNLYEVYI